MKKPIDQMIIDKMDELDAEALLLDETMVLGTASGGRYVYASVDAPEEVYWNSKISDEEAVRIFNSAKTIEYID